MHACEYIYIYEGVCVCLRMPFFFFQSDILAWNSDVGFCRNGNRVDNPCIKRGLNQDIVL